VQQNVPNPFNMSEAQSTSIKFTMGVSENVSVRVFDMLGHEIRSLVQDEVMTPGAHAIQWDGRSTNGAQVANGLYYYQITSPSFTQTVKMEVIR
jgi:flagellar hook assembly protein FlgD